MSVNPATGGGKRPDPHEGSTFFTRKPPGNPPPSTPPPPAAPEENVSESSRKLRKKRHSINRWATRLFAFLMLLTTVMIGSDWYKLYYLRQHGLRAFFLAYASSKLAAVDCHAEVVWKKNPAAKEGLAVLVKVDGRTLPCRLPIPSTQGRVEKFRVEIEVPRQCRSGDYQGDLVFHLPDELAGSPPIPPCTIDLNVQGFLQQWQHSIWYLGLILVFYLSLYVLFTLLLPVPRGKIQVRRSEGDPFPVSLHRQGWSWIFPWLRSELSLRWVSRKARGLDILDGHPGNLSFDYAVCLELENPGDSVRLIRSQARRPKPDDGQKCPRLLLLHPGSTVVVFWDHSKTRSESLTYLS